VDTDRDYMGYLGVCSECGEDLFEDEAVKVTFPDTAYMHRHCKEAKDEAERVRFEQWQRMNSNKTMRTEEENARDWVNNVLFPDKEGK
jgi:hypothetical protein